MKLDQMANAYARETSQKGKKSRSEAYLRMVTAAASRKLCRHQVEISVVSGA